MANEGSTHYDPVETGEICHPECVITTIKDLRAILLVQVGVAARMSLAVEKMVRAKSLEKVREIGKEALKK